MLTHTCNYTFKSGKNKGLPCGRPCGKGGACSKHDTNSTKANDTEKGEKVQSLSTESIEYLYLRFATLNLTPENKSIIEKKFKYISTLKPSSSEYIKNFAWLKHALNFPFDKSVDVPVTCPTMDLTISKNTQVIDTEKVSPETATYIAEVYKKLDDYVYGMDQVKEEILGFVCKRIANPQSTDHVLALQGGYGVGKCFAVDTPIRMYDGRTKMVQDIQVGDQLLGDDETPRLVTALGRGHSELYQIQHTHDPHLTYTVNGDHILVLQDANKETVEITVTNFLRLEMQQQKSLYGFARAIKSRPMFDMNYSARLHFLQQLVDQRQTKKDTGKFIATFHTRSEREKAQTVATSLGIRTIQTTDEHELEFPDKLTEHDALYSQITVTPVGLGNYYGFAIDGNERFLLGNCVVTHNTRLARGLSHALNLPFRTINMGSVNDVSYFTGHGFTYVESEPGRIVQILSETQCKNCIIYFDELDKIHQTEKAQAINGFLTHLIDPSQSKSFQDVYLSGLELDLSQVFFVFSFNDINLVDKTVLDRLKVIHISDPSTADKMEIAQKFLVPEICDNVKLNIKFDQEIIKKIVMSQGENHGLRSIKRAFEEIILKINVLRMLGEEDKKKLTFYGDTYNHVIDKTLETLKNDQSDTTRLMMYS